MPSGRAKRKHREAEKVVKMSVNVAAHLVRIHVDREIFESPDPTTGKALYALAEIPNHRELFREVPGDHEDKLVPRDDTVIDLKKDDHFYSQKAVTVGINGEPFETTETRLSFEELVKIAFPILPTGTCIEFTVTYRDGPPSNPKGTLTAGHSVKIKNRMKFDVTATDRS
ncbi:multiubiquitin domain-containing protein [Mesorhizobium sp. M0715]|uniref:multiubiquitin domain-containing protein n=1 Tax=Mesorhizobium sp. M0715 TaxID=2956990 RepID=UPI0033366143